MEAETSDNPCESKPDSSPQEPVGIPPVENTVDTFIGCPQSPNRANREQAPFEQRNNSWFSEQLMLVLTAVIAFSAMSQWWVTKGQLDEMRESSMQTDALIQQSAEQARAAIALANAAEKNLQETRILFNKGQRPYVIQRATLHPISNNSPIRVDLSRINYGKSPAVKTATSGSVFIGENAMAEAEQWFEVHAPTVFRYETGEVIAPSSNPEAIPYSSVFSDKVITGNELKSLKNGSSAVIITTRTAYRDISNNLYWTDACFMYYVTGAVAYCHKHNEVH
jgi:hypothetical protein